MKHLLFIRHAAVIQEPTISSHKWVLSENGRYRTYALIPHIAAYTPSRIITSHEQKAMQTGQIITEALDLPRTTAPGLQEHNRTGAPYFEDVAEFHDTIQQLFLQPDELIFGTETATQARTRFTRAIHTLLAQYPTDTLAIVSHGTVLTLFLTHHNPHLDPIPFWQQLKLPDLVVVTPPQMTLLPINN